MLSNRDQTEYEKRSIDADLRHCNTYRVSRVIVCRQGATILLNPWAKLDRHRFVNAKISGILRVFQGEKKIEIMFIVDPLFLRFIHTKKRNNPVLLVLATRPSGPLIGQELFLRPSLPQLLPPKEKKIGEGRTQASPAEPPRI